MTLPCEDIGGGPAEPAEPDQCLMLRVAQQDRSAFEALYGRYAARIGAYLMRLLRDRGLAEECFDDVMLVVWQKADRFETGKRVSAWLLGIAHRKALKALEKQRRRLDLPAPAADASAAEIASDGGEHELSLLGRDRLARLANAVAALSPEQRAVIELTFVEHCSYAEIAEITGVPVNTVKTRMFHARKRLRESLPDLCIA
jgi:RNA polymerase sigma-70 factor (ECF subfamily)